MKGRCAAWSLAALLSTMASVALAADDPLKVCLDEDRPPLSMHHRGKPDAGFDVLLAQAIAERLGRKLAIQWFESKLDEDSSRSSRLTPCSPTGAARWSAATR